MIGADSADLPLVLESDDAQHAHCRLCKRALDEALFHGTAARRHVACACGARVTMRPSPEGVVPRWTRGVVIGEDEDRVDEVAHAKTGAAVILDCASCGASLRFDAAGHAKCGYCATEGVIDDDLWRRLHGTRPRKRFYYWEDPAEVLRLEADEKARDRASSSTTSEGATFASWPALSSRLASKASSSRSCVAWASSRSRRSPCPRSSA